MIYCCNRLTLIQQFNTRRENWQVNKANAKSKASIKQTNRRKKKELNERRMHLHIFISIRSQHTRETQKKFTDVRHYGHSFIKEFLFNDSALLFMPRYTKHKTIARLYRYLSSGRVTSRQLWLHKISNKTSKLPAMDRC